MTKITKQITDEFNRLGWVDTLEIIVFNPENLAENITITIDKPEISGKTTKPALEKEISKRIHEKISASYTWAITGIDVLSKGGSLKVLLNEEKNKH